MIGVPAYWLEVKLQLDPPASDAVSQASGASVPGGVTTDAQTSDEFKTPLPGAVGSRMPPPFTCVFALPRGCTVGQLVDRNPQLLVKAMAIAAGKPTESVEIGSERFPIDVSKLLQSGAFKGTCFLLGRHAAGSLLAPTGAVDILVTPSSAGIGSPLNTGVNTDFAPWTETIDEEDEPSEVLLNLGRSPHAAKLLSPARSPAPPPAASPVPEIKVSIATKSPSQDKITFHKKRAALADIADDYTCELQMRVHSAADLPLLPSGSNPTPQVRAMVEGIEAGAVTTRAAAAASRNPVWHEDLIVRLRPADIEAGREVLLQVEDAGAEHSVLARFFVPLQQLRPFHQYNMQLVQAGSLSGVSAPHVFVTFALKTPVDLPNTQLTLEVVLRSIVGLPKNSPAAGQRLVAVARLVTQQAEYVQELEQQAALADAGKTAFMPWMVQVPNAEPGSFDVRSYGGVRGQPVSAAQLALSEDTRAQPAFNFVYCFTEPLYAVFAPAAALVIEFYPDPSASSSAGGGSGAAFIPRTRELLGYAVVPLDAECRRRLEEGENVLRLDSVRILGGKLAGGKGSPVVRLALKLHTPGNRPRESAELLSMAGDDVQSTITTLSEEMPADKQQVSLDQPPPFENPLPGIDELSSIFSTSVKSAELGGASMVDEALRVSDAMANDRAQGTNGVASERRMESGMSVELQRYSADVEYKQLQTQHMIARLAEETDRKIAAIKRMSMELLELRKAEVQAQQRGKELRQELAENQAATKVLIDTESLADVPQEQLVRSYIDLCQRYTAEVERQNEYRYRVQHLQNQLIQKNELEKTHLELERKHRDDSLRLQKLQEKVARVNKYLAAASRQEEVIKQLEDLICRNKGRGIDRSTCLGSDAYSKLIKRHTQLSHELQKMQERAAKRLGSNPTGLEVYLDLEHVPRDHAEAERLRHKLRDVMDTAEQLQQELALNEAKSGGVDGERQLAMIARRERAEQRCQVLQEQIRQAVREHEAEVAELRAELMRVSAAAGVIPGTPPLPRSAGTQA